MALYVGLEDLAAGNNGIVDPLLQIETLEQKLSTNLNKLYEARRRRAMYLGFAEAPVSFINAAIASQVSCVLQLMPLGDAG